ncbi:MAG: acyloxyacyl hydrolase [Bacteroidales bacterium]|nr:acyloxyacyl hydrolase [Bacteroidales bacterium]
MEFLTRKHFPLYEISVLTNTTGRNLWEAQCNYPTYGFSFICSGLSSPELGNLYGLYPFIDFPFKQWKSHNYIALRVGLGLGYLTNPFDRITNYHNFAYGSHLNALIHFELQGKIHLIPRLSLKGGISFTHLSNGTTKEPNFGLNIPALVAGVEYQINNTPGDLIERQWEKRQKYPYKLVVDIYGAWKDISKIESPLYFTGNLSFNLLKQYRPCRSWGAGIDFDYDKSDIAIKKQNHVYEGPDILYTRIGIKAMHQWNISHLLIGVQFGYYLVKKDKSDGHFFDFLTIGYEFNDHIYAGIALKSHWAKADYIGFGIRTTLWKSKIK